MKRISQVLFSTILLGLSINVHAAASLPNGVNCSTNDLTVSLDCVGIYDPGNDHGVNSIFTETTFISTFGTGWTELSKIEDPGWGTGNLGLTITGQGATSGDWSVDSNAWDGFMQGEVIAILKAGNDAAAFEVDLDYTSGAWDVSSAAWAANDGKNSALSHFSFWSTSVPMPEPSILVLFGAGILGMGLAMRRRKS